MHSAPRVDDKFNLQKMLQGTDTRKPQKNYIFRPQTRSLNQIFELTIKMLKTKGNSFNQEGCSYLCHGSELIFLIEIYPELRAETQ